MDFPFGSLSPRSGGATDPLQRNSQSAGLGICQTMLHMGVVLLPAVPAVPFWIHAHGSVHAGVNSHISAKRLHLALIVGITIMTGGRSAWSVIQLQPQYSKYLP